MVAKGKMKLCSDAVKILIAQPQQDGMLLLQRQKILYSSCNSTKGTWKSNIRSGKMLSMQIFQKK